MTIKEFLKDYYGILQVYLNLKLANWLIAQKDNELAPFIWLLEKHFKLSRGIHPDVVVNFCNEKLSLNTVEELGAWITRFNSLYNGDFMGKINPQLNLTLRGTTSYIQLKQIIMNSSLDKESYCLWRGTDSIYRTIDYIDLEQILMKCPVMLYPYVRDARDCDDFSMMFKGWLAYHGYGNISIGRVEVNYWREDNSFYAAHAINIIILDNGKCELIEPQNNTIITNIEDDPICPSNGHRRLREIRL